MIRSRFVAASLLALALAFPAHAQTQRFTLDLVRKAVGVSGPRFSPDGKTIAFTVSHPNYADDRTETELYVADVATGAVRQLTFERRQVSMPRWTPDGRALAFLAPDSSGKDQVWLMPMGGGDAQRLTHAKTDVQHYNWRPDGGALAYAAEDEEPKKEGEARHLATVDIGDQDIFLRTALRPQHIWVQTIGDSSAKRLTSGAWSLELVLPPGSPPSELSWSDRLRARAGGADRALRLGVRARGGRGDGRHPLAHRGQDLPEQRRVVTRRQVDRLRAAA
jgi:dipeptidyl aminopeptidase/acylaminoacyl peptidase